MMIESPRPRSVATVGAKVWGGGRWSPLDEGGVVPIQCHPGHPVSSVSPPGLAARRELVEQVLAGEGEAAAMAQTNQAWDWGVELCDEERSELELLRG